MVKEERDFAGPLRFLKNAEGMLVAIILAMILWVGQTTYGNSILLTTISVQLTGVIAAGQVANKENKEDFARIDGHLTTIWPRLREIKERVQHLESLSPADSGAKSRWAY